MLPTYMKSLTGTNILRIRLASPIIKILELNYSNLLVRYLYGFIYTQ